MTGRGGVSVSWSVRRRSTGNNGRSQKGRDCGQKWVWEGNHDSVDYSSAGGLKDNSESHPACHRQRNQ